MNFKAYFLICVFLLEGCASFDGGMPNLPYDIQEDLGVAKNQLSSYASVKAFYDDPKEINRNKYISAKLLTINYAYLEFVKDLTTEEAVIHSASEILVLALDIGATGSTVTTTKTALSGISSLIGGSRLSIDKNAYYEKSMTALVSGMNANRKEILVRLLDGMGKSLDSYPFEQAMSDINDYYQAGTIMSAISTLQKVSGTKEENADKAIKNILLNRDKGFVSATKQAQVDSMLDDVDELADASALSLASAPPISDPVVSTLVQARDPNNLRLTDASVAKQILKMQVIYWERNDTNLKLWRAAIAALPTK
ncbi:hypothetical protein [Teredinibacter turnerae]|uniref:hypothetical protein n=1 Tax=Teredinibacter turnerae TaxID=2426 RepID=UPI00036919AB|nr:hypothetical protein [Teredinibacter turnerae]